MDKNSNGKRYKPSEKNEILEFLESHTYKETFEKYNVSEPTIARWKKSLISLSDSNKTINLILPDFWREYLDELVENQLMGKDYTEIIVTFLRQYARNQIMKKKSTEALDKYLSNLETLISTTLHQSPEIEAFLVIFENKVFCKTDGWGETDTMISLVQIWNQKHLSINEILQFMPSFEINKEPFGMRDISRKHIIASSRGDTIIGLQNRKLLIGLKRDFENDEVILFARSKPKRGDNQRVMNILKRIAMGMPPIATPLISQEIIQEAKNKNSEIPEFEPELMGKRAIREIRQAAKQRRYLRILRKLEKGVDREQIKAELDVTDFMINNAIEWNENGQPNKKYSENYLESLEKSDLIKSEKEFQKIESKKEVIHRFKKKINLPLLPEELIRLEKLEREIGRKLVRINSTNNMNYENLEPEYCLDGDKFPAEKYPNHYLAMDGKITGISLGNMNFSSIPAVLNEFPFITYLNLQKNQLNSIPNEIGNLKFLSSLILDHNLFTTIPSALESLPNLEYLSMSHNRISQIPSSFTDRKVMKNSMINLKNNQIEHKLLTPIQKELELKNQLILH
jgi:hypothetical protein